MAEKILLNHATLKNPLKLHTNLILYILLIMIVGLIAYSNTFQIPFHFDDKPNITENSLIKNARYFIEPSEYCSRISQLSDKQYMCHLFNMRYIGYLTFGINYQLGGLNVIGYHVFNFSIHLINALLVYLLVVFTFETPFLKTSKLKDYSKHVALFSSLLFISHPVQTQAVTYIVQRFASLATMFYMSSVVLYAKWRLAQENVSLRIQNPGKKQSHFNPPCMPFYVLSLISAVLAMKTKEIAFTLPVMIIVYEVIFFQGKIKKRILYLIPFFLTMAIIPLSLLGMNERIEDLLADMSETTKVATNMSRWDYLFTEMRVIVTYIRLIFFPVNQNLDYDYPIYHSFFRPEVFLSVLFLLSIGILGVYFLYRYRDTFPYTRLISFGIFWFFITLSVESSIIPIVDVIFEHRVYLPSAGAFIAVTTTVFWAAEALKRRWNRVGGVVIATFLIVVVVLTGTTYARNTVWQDDIRLWEDVVSKSPNKARAYYSLGYAYKKRMQIDRAIAMYARTINLDITYFEAYNNLANIFLDIGKYDKSLEFFNLAIAINPNSDGIYNNRGRLFLTISQYDKAIEDFTRAITINPDNARYFINRGCTYSNKGQFKNAIEDFTNAIGINPHDPETYALRGFAYSFINNTINAQVDFRKSCGMGNQNACDALKISAK